LKILQKKETIDQDLLRMYSNILRPIQITEKEISISKEKKML